MMWCTSCSSSLKTYENLWEPPPAHWAPRHNTVTSTFELMTKVCTMGTRMQHTGRPCIVHLPNVTGLPPTLICGPLVLQMALCLWYLSKWPNQDSCLKVSLPVPVSSTICGSLLPPCPCQAHCPWPGSLSASFLFPLPGHSLASNIYYHWGVHGATLSINY